MKARNTQNLCSSRILAISLLSQNFVILNSVNGGLATNWADLEFQMIRATETEVLVSILGKDLTLAAELVSKLWSAGIKAEFKLTTRVQNHIKYALQSGIPWMVLVGESELQKGSVKLKDVNANQEEEVDRKDFVQELKKRLSKP